MSHKPVLLQEAVQSLNLKPGAIAVDGTLGGGGHAFEILQAIGDAGKFIGLDQDPEAIERCSKKFGKDRVHLVKENFVNLDAVLDSLKIQCVDAVLLDIGVSSFQLETPARGFSFQHAAYLDMRMDPTTGATAAELVNSLSQEELEIILRDYGEGRWARRFAGAIAEERKRRPIETTVDLASVIENALPAKLRFAPGKRPVWMRHHPATRTFQALRIAVNQELSILSDALPRIWPVICKGGRLTVISFHSLEDRIVKRQFKEWAQQKEGRLIYKKPLVPSREEMLENPKSRSAKLRTIEKL